MEVDRIINQSGGEAAHKFMITRLRGEALGARQIGIEKSELEKLFSAY